MRPDEVDLEAMIAAEVPIDAAIPAAERDGPSEVNSASRFWFDVGLILGLTAALIWLAAK